MTEPFSDESRPVGLDLLHVVERFYNREARLLDAERYNDWLETCIDPDIHYWMPDMDTRRRDDPRGTFKFGETAYFDDHWGELETRVKRYDEPSAWADNPATRHLHLISNVEVYETGQVGLLGAFSTWINVRNRNETDQDIMHGRREDVLRVTADGLRVLRRRIFTVQNVLLTKNLNTFF
jgi:ethylbenzene dioxygenase beta subunit